MFSLQMFVSKSKRKWLLLYKLLSETDVLPKRDISYKRCHLQLNSIAFVLFTSVDRGIKGDVFHLL